MTSCSLLSKNIVVESDRNICYYPKFPSANIIVKNKLRELNDSNVNNYIKSLVIYKEKINKLKGKTNGQENK